MLKVIPMSKVSKLFKKKNSLSIKILINKDKARFFVLKDVEDSRGGFSWGIRR